MRSILSCRREFGKRAYEETTYFNFDGNMRLQSIFDFDFNTERNIAELDFLTDQAGAIVPIEVKYADNTKAKSLQLFCSRYSPKTAIKSSLKNVGDNMLGTTRVWSIPLYTLFRIKDYIGVADSASQAIERIERNEQTLEQLC